MSDTLKATISFEADLCFPVKGPAHENRLPTDQKLSSTKNAAYQRESTSGHTRTTLELSPQASNLSDSNSNDKILKEDDAAEKS